MTTNDFLARLEGVHQTPQGWAAKCPAHEDKRQSLSVKEGQKGIVCKCHAGCTVPDIAAALKLKLADLFYANASVKQPPAAESKSTKPSGKPRPAPAKPPVLAGALPRPKLVAEYDYLDESGKLLFQVVRFEPKDFRQRSPDANAKGGWNWKTADIRKVLWRLPALLKLAKDDPHRPVVICEGEKDVVACERAGLVATCNPGGAGKWLTGYTASLAPFSRIIIVADKDEPGRKHAQMVATALARANRTVTILEVPGDKNKDAADYFASGGTADALLALADKTPKVQPIEAAKCDPAGSDAELPPCVYDLARQKFFVPSGNEWIALNDTRISVHFRARGYSEFVKDALGVTKLDSALQRVIMERNVKYAGPVAGYWAGPKEMDNKRVLVTESPRLIKPKKGDWSTFQKFAEQLLWDDQFERLQWDLFCGWLRAGFVSLRDKTFQPGLALAICGVSDDGKSFMQKLITECLGSREGKPYDWMTGKDDFNEDFIGTEHLTIDDEASEKDTKSRTALGQRIKQVVVGGAIRFNGKFAKAISARPFFRLSICLNDEPSDLMVLPPMEDSIKNKFLILHSHPATFPKTPDEFQKFRNQIVSELPAFMYWLLNDFKLPAKWHSPRFGVLNWQHPDLLFEIEDLHPWRRLVELIDFVKPWSVTESPTDDMFNEGADGECWEGTTQDLEECLKSRAPGRAQSVLRGPHGTGMDLKSAARRLPGRISSRRSNGSHVWIIKKQEEKV
jgi:hypothetical protein